MLKSAGYEASDDSGADLYGSGSGLADDVYDALKDDDREAFASALKMYVQHCIDESGEAGGKVEVNVG